MDDMEMRRCNNCFGRGYKPKPHKNGKPGFRATPCRTCGGRGFLPPLAPRKSKAEGR